MTDYPHWPLSDEPKLAWRPPCHTGAGTVPLTRDDRRTGLTRDRYIGLLCARVAWMLTNEKRPAGACQQLAEELELLGLWSGDVEFDDVETAVMVLLEDNRAWWDFFFSSIVRLPDDEPWPVTHDPDAVDTIEQTSIWEWIEGATPAFSNGGWETPTGEPAATAEGERAARITLDASAPAAPPLQPIVESTRVDRLAGDRTAAAEVEPPSRREVDAAARAFSGGLHPMLLPLLVAIGFGVAALYLGRLGVTAAGPNGGRVLVTDRWTGIVWLCVPGAAECMQVYPPHALRP